MSINVSTRLSPNIQSPVPVTVFGTFSPPSSRFLREREDMSDRIREDTTMLVQIEEVKCDIRELPFVTKL
jgi:hypothetical protein